MIRSRALRIGLVCPYALDVPGGVQNQVLGLAAFLRRAGHDVHVLAPGGLPEDAYGLEAARFTSAGAALGVRYNGSVAPVAFGPLAAARTRRWVAAHAVDLLHVHEPLAPSASLLALSASSPFWNGQDTGYASFRSIIWQRWPSAGSFGPVEDAAEYDRVLDDLIASGVIADKKMAYFDVRPSSHAPTLELRVCDATPVVDDAVLIAGLFRAAVRKAEKSVVSGNGYRAWPVTVPPFDRTNAAASRSSCCPNT